MSDSESPKILRILFKSGFVQDLRLQSFKATLDPSGVLFSLTVITPAGSEIELLHIDVREIAALF